MQVFCWVCLLAGMFLFVVNKYGHWVWRKIAKKCVGRLWCQIRYLKRGFRVVSSVLPCMKCWDDAVDRSNHFRIFSISRFTIIITSSETSGSHGCKNEGDSILGCCGVYSGRNWRNFQSCLLLPSSGRASISLTVEAVSTSVNFYDTARLNTTEKIVTT